MVVLIQIPTLTIFSLQPPMSNSGIGKSQIPQKSVKPFAKPSLTKSHGSPYQTLMWPRVLRKIGTTHVKKFPFTLKGDMLLLKAGGLKNFIRQDF